MEQPTQQSPEGMRNEILRKIDAREVSMRPKRYFFLQATGAVALAILVFLISAFIFSVIFHSTRSEGHGYLLSFGSQGVLLFIRLFPWWWLAVDLVLIGLLEWVMRRFRFAYRLPTLYVLLGLLVVAALVGFAVDRGTPLNQHLMETGDMRSRAAPERGTCDCVITAIQGGLLTAYPTDNPSRNVTILVPASDPMLPLLKVGDTVFVGGRFDHGILDSFGLHRTDEAPPWQP